MPRGAIVTAGTLAIAGILSIASCTSRERPGPPPRLNLDGIRLAIQDPEPLVRAYAYKDLAEIASPEILDLLDSASKSQMIADLEGEGSQLEVVEAALKATAKIGLSDRQLRPRLHELTGHETTRIRIAALEAIGSACDASGVALLREHLEHDPNPTVRVAALRVARSVWRICSVPAIDVESLLHLIVDGDPSIREEALHFLDDRKAELAGPRFADELLDLLRQQQDTHLCLSLLQALEKTGVPHSLSLPELAGLCSAGRGSAPVVTRGIRTQALRAIAASRPIPLADLMAYLEQPDAIDTPVVFKILREQTHLDLPDLAPFLDRQPIRIALDEHHRRLADFLDITALTQVDEADELDRLIETHVAALLTVTWSGRASEYTEDILGIIETTPPEKDYLGRLRREALDALNLEGDPKNVDPSMLRLIAFMGQDSQVDLLDESIVKAYWRNPSLAHRHLYHVAALLDRGTPVVQARVVSVLGGDEESARTYLPFLWDYYFTRREGVEEDRRDIPLTAILRMVARSNHPQFYLEEIAPILRSEQNDPLGNLRIAAFEVLSSHENYSQLFVADLIHMLKALDTDVERQALELLKSWRLNPKQFVLLLNSASSYTSSSSASAEYRYLTLYFGASPPDNRFLLVFFDLSSDESARIDPNQIESRCPLLADLIQLNELPYRFRAMIKIELSRIGYTDTGICPGERNPAPKEKSRNVALFIACVLLITVMPYFVRRLRHGF